MSCLVPASSRRLPAGVHPQALARFSAPEANPTSEEHKRWFTGHISIQHPDFRSWWFYSVAKTVNRIFKCFLKLNISVNNIFPLNFLSPFYFFYYWWGLPSIFNGASFAAIFAMGERSTAAPTRARSNLEHREYWHMSYIRNAFHWRIFYEIQELHNLPHYSSCQYGPRR
jgi:hypothetical protein